MSERADVGAQTFECAWEYVARGGICGTGAEGAAVLGDVACDASEVVLVMELPPNIRPHLPQCLNPLSILI